MKTIKKPKPVKKPTKLEKIFEPFTYVKMGG